MYLCENGPAMTGRFCTAVSKMRVSGVQNGDGVVPSVPDGGSEFLSRSENATPESILHKGVQNEGKWCPKWGNKVLKF